MLLVKDKRKIVREALKEARLRHGLRQLDVAEVLGRPQSYVAKIESGERKADFVEVLDLCTAIGLDPKALLKKLIN
jgi:transcriptional regulator with XRE-family HTH domain